MSRGKRKYVISACAKVLGLRENAVSGKTRGVLAPFTDIIGEMHTFSSPDGNISVTLRNSGCLSYSVELNGKTVIYNSRISIVSKRVDLCKNVTVAVPVVRSFSESFPERAKKTTANVSFVRYLFPVRHNISGLQYILEFRVYNDGVAFRLRFSEDTRLLVDDERTEFNVNPDSVCYYQTDPVKLQGESHCCDTSLLAEGLNCTCLTSFKIPDAGYMMLSESSLNDYAGCSLYSLGGGRFITKLWDSGSFYTKGLCAPFRLILLGSSLNSFYNCDLVKSTAKPCANLSEYSWVKPVKAAWSFFIDNETSWKYDVIMSFLDDTARAGMNCVIIDNGWRNWALTEPVAFLRVKKVCKKAHSLGIDVWVWKSSTLGPYSSLYRKYFFSMCNYCGVSGVKLDHLERENQAAIRLYCSFLEDAAKHKLLVSYHNPNKPTGLSRTYPNLLTREAVRGLQVYSKPDDNVIIALTRFVPDGADYTPFCFSEPDRQGASTIAHMLATTVIFNSGVLTIAEHPRYLCDSVTKPFIDSVSPVWDESIVLEGSEIGECVLMARRNGEVWYIAGLNGSVEEKHITVTLSDFLTDAVPYNALCYNDVDGNINGISFSECSLTASDCYSAVMSANGGFALRLTPIQ